MKKIVRGNDFTLRIPVRKIVGGQMEKFPLPACEEVEVNLVNAFRRRKLTFAISAEDDSLIEATVRSSEMALGSYALEVHGKLFGCSWRSNEYEQIMLVDNNAKGDTAFGEVIEGEDSVEMDTAIVVLPPSMELGKLIESAGEAISLPRLYFGGWLKQSLSSTTKLVKPDTVRLQVYGGGMFTQRGTWDGTMALEL